VEQPHPYFVEVLCAAREMSQQSGGAFDITVQPLWSLFANAHKVGQSPSDEQVAAALASVAWQNVVATPQRISLRGAATAITLNGIAQGYAADRARAALAKHGVE